MNVARKEVLYAEIARVLARRARFVVYDILAAGRAEFHFPVPWAVEPAASFLATASELDRLLEEAGFAIEEARDPTDAGRAFLAEVMERIRTAAAPPPLGLHLLLGERFPLAHENMVRNFDGRRVELRMLGCRRRS